MRCEHSGLRRYNFVAPRRSLVAEIGSCFPIAFIRSMPGTFQQMVRPILRFAFCFTVAACCLALTAHGQASNPTAAAAPQISKQASDLIQQGYEVLSEHDALGAEHMFRQAIEVQPEVEAAHRGLGLALREEGRLSDAFRELQTATRLDPSDSDAHYTLGSVEWALSLPANAPPGRTGGLTSSDYQNLAAAEFSKALALSPKDPMLRRNLAVLYLDSNRPLEALAQAQEGVKIAPQSPDAHVTLGQALLANSEEDKAASEYEAAIQLDPRNGEAYFALGQLRMVQRRTPQAQEALRHAIQVSPDLGPAYAALAKTLMDEGRNSEARGVLEKAVALNSADWQSQYELAVLLNQAGETARATDLLQKVLKVNPDLPGAREQLASGLLRRGDIAGASALAGKMIAEDPQAPEGHRIMALALWKQRDFDGSLAECAMVLNVEPTSLAALVLQSIALWQQGNKKDAQKAFRDAAKLDPKVGEADDFCRLLMCDAHDINIVSEFLHKNRWLLAPPPSP